MSDNTGKHPSVADPEVCKYAEAGACQCAACRRFAALLLAMAQARPGEVINAKVQVDPSSWRSATFDLTVQ